MKKNRLEFLNYGLAFLVVSISVVLFLLFCFVFWFLLFSILVNFWIFCFCLFFKGRWWRRRGWW